MYARAKHTHQQAAAAAAMCERLFIHSHPKLLDDLEK